MGGQSSLKLVWFDPIDKVLSFKLQKLLVLIEMYPHIRYITVAEWFGQVKVDQYNNRRADIMLYLSEESKS